MSVDIPHLIVQPDDGVTPVRQFIQTARRSLLIKQFTFSEPSLIDAVIDRKNQGVATRVMLNAKRPAAIARMMLLLKPCRRPESISGGLTPSFTSLTKSRSWSTTKPR